LATPEDPLFTNFLLTFSPALKTTFHKLSDGEIRRSLHCVFESLPRPMAKWFTVAPAPSRHKRQETGDWLSRIRAELEEARRRLPVEDVAPEEIAIPDPLTQPTVGPPVTGMNFEGSDSFEASDSDDITDSSYD
jgi:hypothetical protein